MKKLLIILFLLLPVALQAGDEFRMRNCRQRKVPSEKFIHHRAKARAGYNANYLTGQRRQMVVLASFADKQFMQEEPLPQWNKIFNEENLSESPFYGSVRDYFAAQSSGRLQLTFDLFEVALADSCKKYRSTDYDDENSKYLVSDIVDSLLTRDIDWSPYDWDSDGYIDQLLIIYAGKGMNADGDSTTIWPHMWWLSLHENFEARTFTKDGVEYTVDSYCCVQEETKGNYGTFGVICHEYSHCFGLPDFYEGSTSFVDKWDLMDYGCYNGAGFCPSGYSAHERMLLGWLTPTELTEDTVITAIPAMGSDAPAAYLVRNDGYADEYYIIENRQRVGWDSQLPASGVLIFRIDYDEPIWLKDLPNTSKLQRYTLFHANNDDKVKYSSYWCYPYEQNDSLTNTSVPAATLSNENIDGSLLMSKSITKISVDADGLASFAFAGRTTTAVSPVWWTSDDGDQQTVYDLSGRYLGTAPESLPRGVNIIRCEGKTRKVVKP